MAINVLLNNQPLGMQVDSVCGFYRKDDETVTLYRGNIVGRKYIVLEGKLYAIDEQQALQTFQAWRTSYSSTTNLKIQDITKQCVLKDIHVLKRYPALRGYVYIITLVFEEV